MDYLLLKKIIGERNRRTQTENDPETEEDDEKERALGKFLGRLYEEMENTDDGNSDSRRKGTGIKQILEDYVLIWSCGDGTTRATHGVDFILHPDTAKNVLETEFISERIIKIRVRGEQKISNFTQAYAPCNDSCSEEQKEDFFEKMADTMGTVTDREELIVMGNFNGRVGKRRTHRD
ncbi:uncharacterized protein LOC106013819 [Aplysia californica]|uniref:Uncharacterized protein LOC106013819 n=1 Tax=Aplysia californica TaxID=6500 RepID=A0ABM1AE61_APLCA|nr:uncharacterized protein LOC106013819 [Aplysia californica]